MPTIQPVVSPAGFTYVVFRDNSGMPIAARRSDGPMVPTSDPDFLATTPDLSSKPTPDQAMIQAFKSNLNPDLATCANALQALIRLTGN